MSDVIRLAPKPEGGRLANMVDMRFVTACAHCDGRTFKLRRYQFGDGEFGPWEAECANCERPASDVKIERTDG